MTELKSNVVKKSISLSKVVADWADELAETKGFGSNYSAYIADLIRRDWERENDLQLARLGKAGGAGGGNPVDEIVKVISEAARKKKAATRK